MELFFFHIQYGEMIRDEEGVVLPGLNAARSAAVSMVGQMLRDDDDRFWAKPDLTVTVADGDNRTLWTLSVTGRASSSGAAALGLPG